MILHANDDHMQMVTTCRCWKTISSSCLCYSSNGCGHNDGHPITYYTLDRVYNSCSACYAHGDDVFDDAAAAYLPLYITWCPSLRFITSLPYAMARQTNQTSQTPATHSSQLPPSCTLPSYHPPFPI